MDVHKHSQLVYFVLNSFCFVLRNWTECSAVQLQNVTLISVCSASEQPRSEEVGLKEVSKQESAEIIIPDVVVLTVLEDL